MRTLFICILTPLLALQVGCSGQGFSSDPELGNKTDQPPETNERDASAKKKTDTKATEPSIIVGAYLACNKVEDSSSGNPSYGCALMTKEHKKLVVPAGLELRFGAMSDRFTFAPIYQAALSAHHVIFEISEPLTKEIIVNADLISPLESINLKRYQVSIPVDTTLNSTVDQAQQQEKPMGSQSPQNTRPGNCRCERRM